MQILHTLFVSTDCSSTMNFASHDGLHTSERSSTMSTSDDSTPGIAAAAYTTPLVNLCLRFPQPGVRAIPVLGNDEELWILVADGR